MSAYKRIEIKVSNVGRISVWSDFDSIDIKHIAVCFESIKTLFNIQDTIQQKLTIVLQNKKTVNSYHIVPSFKDWDIDVRSNKSGVYITFYSYWFTVKYLRELFPKGCYASLRDSNGKVITITNSI